MRNSVLCLVLCLSVSLAMDRARADTAANTTAGDEVEQATKLLADFPAAFAPVAELGGRIVLLTQDLVPWKEGEDEALTLERKQLREMVVELEGRVQPLYDALHAAVLLARKDARLRSMHNKLQDARTKVTPYRDAVRTYKSRFRVEDEARAEAEKEAAPITDRSLVSRVKRWKGPAEKLFAKTHPTHFVFPLVTLQQDREKRWLARSIPKGEPVLIVGGDGVSGLYSVITIDGINAAYWQADLSIAPLKTSSPHPLKAEWLTVSDDQGVIGGPADFESDSTGFYLNASAFLRGLAPGDARIDAYVTRRERVLSCYQNQLERLDPDNRRGKYDIVRYGANGEVRKVESLGARYDRQACAKCGCKAFNDQKRVLARAAIAPLQKARYVELEPVLDGLGSAFKRR